MSEIDGTRPAEQSRVTIMQVAELAGVSPTTVSHVLSGKRVVAPDTRGVVHDAIQKLGYRPNHVARSLRTRRSQMVAVLVPDITNTFYSVLTRGLADKLDGAGYGTYVCNTDGITERESKFLDDILDRGADGIVIASIDMVAVSKMGPGGLGIPMVCIGGAMDHPSADVVTADDEVGSHAVTAHLLGRGAKRAAMIAGPRASGAARVHGFVRALEEAGQEPDPQRILHGDWTRKGGHEAMCQFLALPKRRRPDAVFCANDLTAIGAIDAVHEAGLRIPDDVAIAGFDDVDAATIVNPPLTTAVNPAYDTGANAGELLMSRLRGAYSGPSRTVVLPCPLVVRDSG